MRGKARIMWDLFIFILFYYYYFLELLFLNCEMYTVRKKVIFYSKVEMDFHIMIIFEKITIENNLQILVLSWL